jgi:hypothetical protein
MYTVDKLKPYKCDIVKKWTVSSDLTRLETFDNCSSNYDVIDRLKENKVLTDSCEDDSEYCQAWLYFKSETAAQSFTKRLAKYVEKRKELIKSL